MFGWTSPHDFGVDEHLRGDRLPPGHGGPERVDLPANVYCPGCGIPRRPMSACPRCGATYDDAGEVLP